MSKPIKHQTSLIYFCNPSTAPKRTRNPSFSSFCSVAQWQNNTERFFGSRLSHHQHYTEAHKPSRSPRCALNEDPVCSRNGSGHRSHPPPVRCKLQLACSVPPSGPAPHQRHRGAGASGSPRLPFRRTYFVGGNDPEHDPSAVHNNLQLARPCPTSGGERRGSGTCATRT